MLTVSEQEHHRSGEVGVKQAGPSNEQLALQGPGDVSHGLHHSSCTVSSMRAVTVIPLKANTVELTDLPEPPLEDGPVLVKTRAIGVCGTDIEIIAGDYGWAPPGEERLALGHESLGEVLEAPAGSGFAAGDLVVGIVRRPDPLPCINSA